MKTKEWLKRLLLVTLVLCISMLGTTVVFAEEPARQPAVVLWSPDPIMPSEFESYLNNLIVYHQLVLIDAAGGDVEYNDSLDYWFMIYFAENDPAIELPDPDTVHIAGVFFADSITTPEGETEDESVDAWVEYLTELSKKGIPVYVFTSIAESGVNLDVSVICHKAIQKIDEMASNPDSGISKLEGIEISKVVERINIEQSVYAVAIDEESSGYIYAFVSPREFFRTTGNAGGLLRDIITRVVAPEDLK